MNTLPPYALMASFITFAKSKNMQLAAQTLGLSQPALTNHLKSFETYFPQAVFTFEGRKKILTDFGLELKTVLESRFDHLDEDLRVLNERVQDPKHIHLKMAARHEIICHFAGRINFPGTLEFTSLHTESVVDSLIERKIDIGLSYDVSKAHQLHAKKFFNYSYSLAIPQKWKMKNNRVSPTLIEKLCDFSYLSHRSQSENLDTLLKNYKIKQNPHYKKIVPDWRTLCELVQSGEGWAIVPQYFLKDFDRIDDIPIPVSLIPEVQFYLLYRKESLTRPWFKNILDQLHKSMHSD